MSHLKKIALSAAVALIATVTALAMWIVPAGITAASSSAAAPVAKTATASAQDFAAYHRRHRHHRRHRKVRKPAAGLTTTSTVTTTATAATGAVSTVAATDDLSVAQALLADLIAQHPILAGTTVEIGDARGYQAIAYYTSGRIVISPTHTASITKIMNHEIWHVIDWRDNNAIDWGECIPPASSAN